MEIRNWGKPQGRARFPCEAEKSDAFRPVSEILYGPALMQQTGLHRAVVTL